MTDNPGDDQRPHTRRRTDKLLAAQKAEEAKEQRVAGLETQVGELSEQLKALAGKAAGARPAPVPAIRWHELDDDTYAEKMTELRQWMRTVLFGRHPIDAKTVIACWARHPAVVEALTVGWQTWTVAWSDQADPAMRAQWIGMWRPNMLAHISKELHSCLNSGHPRTPRPPDPCVIDGIDPNQQEETAA